MKTGKAQLHKPVYEVSSENIHSKSLLFAHFTVLQIQF